MNLIFPNSENISLKMNMCIFVVLPTCCQISLLWCLFIKNDEYLLSPDYVQGSVPGARNTIIGKIYTVLNSLRFLGCEGLRKSQRLVGCSVITAGQKMKLKDYWRTWWRGWGPGKTSLGERQLYSEPANE